MGQKQFFVEDLIELKFHNNFIWEKYGQKEGEKNTVMSSHSATIYSDTSVSTLPLRWGSPSLRCIVSTSKTIAFLKLVIFLDE